MSSTRPIPPTLLAAYDAARAICQHHARSFFFASHFLPRPKRDHAYAVYAFCRLLDDAADEEPSLESVDRFVALLDDVYAKQAMTSVTVSIPHPDVADHLALAAFAHTARTCQIPKRLFLDLAEGCRMDFKVTRYDTWAQLERYCYHVAGVVGLIMCHVFDVRDGQAQDQAVAMGNAMQLTNILRDVREDLDRGRVYLPREDFERFGVSEAELQTRRLTPQMASLVRFQIERARRLYREGSAGLCAIPNDGSRLTACVMAVVYGGILGAIEELKHDVFAGRAKLSTLQKLLRLPKAFRLAQCERGDMVPEVF